MIHAISNRGESWESYRFRAMVARAGNPLLGTKMNTPLIDEAGPEQQKLISSTPHNAPPIAVVGLLKSARDELLAVTPEAANGCTVSSLRTNDLDITLHGVKTYKEACNLMVRFGLASWDTKESWVTGYGHGFCLSVFFQDSVPQELITAPKEEVPF